MKDRRGTEIEIGSLVIWGSGSDNHGIGRVTSMKTSKDYWHRSMISVSGGIKSNPGAGRQLQPYHVTVVTKEEILEVLSDDA